MFTVKKKPKTVTANTPAEEEPRVKYPKPKVLLLNVKDNAAEALIKCGFNVCVGSLGTPYNVGKDDGYQPVIGKAKLPNYTEQEIVIVDLHFEDFDDGPDGEKHRPDGEPDLWAKCDRGYIDPRPRTAFQVREAFDRTLDAGGVFVVFADARSGVELVIARKEAGRFGGLYDQRQFPHNEWHFVNELCDANVRDDHGTEMRSTDSSALGKLLAAHLADGRFLCTVEGGYRRDDPWVTLAENKFGEPVAICRCRGQNGTVIVVPQIDNKSDFLTTLFNNVLPELAPHLFPHIEKGRWTVRDEYELPRVLEIREARATIEERARNEVAKLTEELEKERAASGWLHDLLTGTDATLVEAVKRALAVVGFTKVVDVDEERDREGKSRREDLQIHDRSPTLVVDVKGIGGFPSDEDALQADKHATIRMREQKRTDIVGLSIINHQRHLPPLDRENTMPFRQELLDAAEERTLGLITGWDLYRAVRNFKKFGWRPVDIMPLFYRKGRILVVPFHYQFIGTVAKAWTDKFGVVLEDGELRVGDRVAVEFPIEFEEVAVASLKVEDRRVDCAVVGDPTGLLWPAGMPKLREGMRVFRIPAGK